MNSPPRVHAMVMAGGAGSRLQPLTSGMCKPALPFGGNYCVVDFVLGNLWNSGVPRVELLVQHEPDALIDHVRRTWQRPRAAGGEDFCRVARPGAGQAWRGTADAVLHNLHRVPAQADLVLVFGADHVYRMDVQQMIDFHRAQHADATVAALPVPLAQASAFGIVDADAHGRVMAFHEKPRAAVAMPQRPGHALASMGNYIFNADVLRRELALAHARGDTDFGHHVLPRLLHNHRVMAYDFAGNHVPGLKPHEQPGYWRDVGTIDAYFAAHLDTLGVGPAFELNNAQWPVLPHAAPAEPAQVLGGQLRHSRIGAGSVVRAARLDHCVLGRHVRVDSGAKLEFSVLLDGATVGAGARLRNVIVDRDNVVPAGEEIGYDDDYDRERFPVSEGGVVVVPRGHYAAAPVARAHAELSLHG